MRLTNPRSTPTAAPGAPAKPDLDTQGQIHDLVTLFYREIVFDELLEPIFSEVAEVDWAEHIPRLIEYWCWILLGADSYPGTVTRTHRQLHGLQPLEHVHCDRWFALWIVCIDEGWSGPFADRAKSHAAKLMTGLAKHVFGFDWSPPIVDFPERVTGPGRGRAAAPADRSSQRA